MAKISFQGKKTEWQGLWYHPEFHSYTSAILNLKALKDFKGTCQIRMFKNQQRRKGDNRPTYLFTICDREAYEDAQIAEVEVQDIDLEVGDIEENDWINDQFRKLIKEGAFDEEIEEAGFYSREEVRTILRDCINDVMRLREYGICDPYDILPEDYF